jgi:hypothetical protein
MASVAVKVKCAIAIDSGNECLGEIILALLPVEWRPYVTFSTYDQWTDVIEMVRNAQPALLVVHTNLLMLSPDGIERCIAVSPNSRYLFFTAWAEEDIDHVLKAYESFPVSALRMPFDRAQLVAALKNAFEIVT